MKKPMPTGQLVLRNILFATDFSAPSMRALPYAANPAREYGAKLYASHVVPIESYLVGDAQAKELLRVARTEAESNLSELVRSPVVGSIPTTTLLDNGDIWSVLQGFIEQYSVDMLVVGTTGRSGLGKVLLGSVAEEAIRESPCPVLTVGPKTPEEIAIRLRNILCASDFSADSLVAAPYAFSLAEKFQARLTLLHVIPSLPESPYLDAQMARVRLGEIASAHAPLATAPNVVVEMGSPANMILKLARDLQTDLIVIGARGAGALPRLASHFGSIAHNVVSHANCPVLTVGGPRAESAGDTLKRAGGNTESAAD
jgi:nucleotide-binding universal stress UspA family protein